MWFFGISVCQTVMACDGINKVRLEGSRNDDPSSNYAEAAPIWWRRVVKERVFSGHGVLCCSMFRDNKEPGRPLGYMILQSMR